MESQEIRIKSQDKSIFKDRGPFLALDFLIPDAIFV